VFDANEFRDADYVANPVNRCYFCKTHLYGAIAVRTSATVLSGTNTDDLGDYRPGPRAPEDFNVSHPYVEVGIDKPGLRSIAGELGLADVADLRRGLRWSIGWNATSPKSADSEFASATSRYSSARPSWAGCPPVSGKTFVVELLRVGMSLAMTAPSN
jgi:hypothetical protein